MKILIQSLILLLMTSSSAYALSFPINNSTDVVGKIFTVTPQNNDTFSRYARIYDVGAYALQRANPGINEDYPDKQSKDIIVPAQFVLPSKRSGIVINLPELRLYYFNGPELYTYPVSIGRDGWSTPVMETSVVQKEKDPVWIVPDSILADEAAKGHPIPRVTPAGPHNPLGQYALHTSKPGYLIHGTSTSTSIGRRVSHGCIRLFPADIDELFHAVPVGTPISVINEPIKAGMQGNQLFLQVYPTLHEHPISQADRQTLANNVINTAQGGRSIQIDWKLVEDAMKQQSGIPVVIGR